MNVAEQLKTSGKVQRGQLGVIIQEVSYDLAKSFGLDKASGALIAKVMPNSPAMQAGLQVGDIVRSVNGEEVRVSSDLPVMVGSMLPGKEVSLEVWRKGEKINVKVKLGSMAEQNETSSRATEQPQSANPADGFTVDNTGLTLRVDEGAGKKPSDCFPRQRRGGTCRTQTRRRNPRRQSNQRQRRIELPQRVGRRGQKCTAAGSARRQYAFPRPDPAIRCNASAIQ